MNVQHKHAFLDALKAVGIIKVYVEFAGEGDSGQVQGIRAEGLAEGADLKTIPVPKISGAETRTRAGQTYENGRWVQQYGHEILSIHDYIEDVAYELLSETGVDWYNNDGGNGTIVIVPGHEEIAVQMQQRTVEYDTTYHHLGFADEANKIADDAEQFWG